MKFKVVVVSFFLFLLSSCSSIENISLFKSKIKFTVIAAVNSNNGGVVHMMVKSVSKTDFVNQSYDELYEDLMAEKYLIHEIISPNSTKIFNIPKEKIDKESLGIYFFFKDTSGKWRKLVSNPLPGKIIININNNDLYVS